MTLDLRERYAQMRVSLLLDRDGSGTMVKCGVVAEAALRQLLGTPAERMHALGKLIEEIWRQPEDKRAIDEHRLRRLQWLNKLRISSAHAKAAAMPSPEDALEAAELVTDLIVHLELLSTAEIRSLAQDAARRVAARPSEDILILDRSSQRTRLDDLINLAAKGLVLVVDGEIGQGHEYFSEVTQWRLRAGPKGRWRALTVSWPAPPGGPATRFGMLIENLAKSVGFHESLPERDPLSDAGAAVWDVYLRGLMERLASLRTRFYIRHAISWVTMDDVHIIRHYLERFWSLAQGRLLEPFVVVLDVIRAESHGIPWLSRSWLAGRREHQAALQIIRYVEGGPLSATRCAVLDELTSISARDLETWLQLKTELSGQTARRVATEILESTRGGRFELVARRVGSIYRNT